MLIQALDRAQSEVAEGRKYIDALESQVKLKENRIAALDTRDSERIKLEASLNLEITALNAAILEQKTALKFATAEVVYLKAELEKVSKKYRRSLKREKWFAIIAGAAIVGFLLK